MNDVKATILIPTTKGRGPVLPYSVGSVLNQTVKEIEIFIIGDGVDDSTRKVIHDLQKKDTRITFFDHPKGPRRGEIYRHDALMNHAKGEIVCYLLDRDLYLSNHVETAFEYLINKNHSFYVGRGLNLDEQGKVIFCRRMVSGKYDFKKLQDESVRGFFLFSPVSHTLESYRNLPFGWRTTPSKYRTDIYMWEQFISYDKKIEMIASHDSTILYFKRGNHPGLSAHQRAKELAAYFNCLSDQKKINDLTNKAFVNLIIEYEKLLVEPILIKGQSVSTVPIRILKKFKEKLFKKW
ncbi:MAG: glycosyltransferase family A protein [Reichenbachiella sp.]|uniref:glycosyltransferase family 2 protein n=1 Tax=Reichenbachiella sp. TaxID=2184521 RepID=UPI0032977B83